MEISPIYHNSRPEGELPAQETAAFDFLDALGIDYERVTHELADTMEKCDDVSAVLGVDVCKNLFLCNRQKTNFYLLCMPPHKAFHTKDLSHQIGSARLSFAPEEQLWELLHCTPGSATILGLMNDDENRVQLLIDKETYEAEYFSCHPCLCTSTIKLKTSDVKNMLLPKVHHEPTSWSCKRKNRAKRFRRDFFGTFYMSSFTVRYIGLSTSVSEQVQAPAV